MEIPGANTDGLFEVEFEDAAALLDSRRGDRLPADVIAFLKETISYDLLSGTVF
jgi:hypothetical protein